MSYLGYLFLVQLHAGILMMISIVIIMHDAVPQLHQLINLQVFCVTYDLNLGQRAWIGILIPPMVVLSWIRNLNELASFSMVANVCILVTLIIILYEEITSFM